MSTSTPAAQRGPSATTLPPDDCAWSLEHVALFLGVSPSMVRKLEREHRLPALPRIGRRVTFDPHVVRAFRANPDAPQLRAVNGDR
jgi:hypothetical protein